MNKKISVAVLGSTGYVGLELVKKLTIHPNVRIVFLGCENNINKNISYIDKSLNNNNLPILKSNEDFNANDAEIVFLALPHGVSHNFVKKFFNKIKIIDLSADFRIKSDTIYKLNYGNNHSCLNLINEFVYGLTEIYHKDIIHSSNISIPGCYPTSVLLPLIPILKNNLIESNDIIIDSKSGYSGAGKKFDIKNIKNSNNLNFYNYSTNDHRHICEIKQELNKFSKKDVNFSFNPHILPNFRGMMSTIYCKLKNGISSNNIKDLLFENYKDTKFIYIKNEDEFADFFSIQNTNYCVIKLFKHYTNDKLIIVSLIDNLLKGAAGQAIQCFNIMYDFEESLSLINIS